MLIIGCDFHSGFQQLAVFDNQTGEVVEKKLLHAAEASEFYRGLSEPVRVAWSRYAVPVVPATDGRVRA